MRSCMCARTYLCNYAGSSRLHVLPLFTLDMYVYNRHSRAYMGFQITQERKLKDMEDRMLAERKKNEAALEKQKKLFMAGNNGSLSAAQKRQLLQEVRIYKYVLMCVRFRVDVGVRAHSCVRRKNG